jgi:hypothetical protein
MDDQGSFLGEEQDFLFQSPREEGSEADPASCTEGTGSHSSWKRGRGVHSVGRYRTIWFTDNALDFHSGGSRFESLAGE